VSLVLGYLELLPVLVGIALFADAVHDSSG